VLSIWAVVAHRYPLEDAEEEIPGSGPGLGIDTRGKSRRLKINDRTSQQILGWALGILTGQPIDDLNGDIEPEVG